MLDSGGGFVEAAGKQPEAGTGRRLHLAVKAAGVDGAVLDFVMKTVAAVEADIVLLAFIDADDGGGKTAVPESGEDGFQKA